MLEVTNLTKTYRAGLARRKYRTVVRDVSFAVMARETLGIVGESGCGKTTLAKMILKLLKSDSGRIIVDGQDITGLRGVELQRCRKNIQIMFQNPESSLNPRMKIHDCIAEVLRVNHIASPRSVEERRLISGLADMVGLQPEHLNRYSWELSGGQVQRVVLARVLALRPKVLIVDEPTSMLDVSVQAQVLTIIRQMQQEFNFALVYIAHDLDVIRLMCDRVMIMYQGTIVERGTREDIFERASHPYTRSLLGEFYLFDPGTSTGCCEERRSEPGDWPSYGGCPYSAACRKVLGRCSEKQELRQISPGHHVACCNAESPFPSSVAGPLPVG